MGILWDARDDLSTPTKPQVGGGGEGEIRWEIALYAEGTDHDTAVNKLSGIFPRCYLSHIVLFISMDI
jgi:hypothetical protein